MDELIFEIIDVEVRISYHFPVVLLVNEDNLDSQELIKSLAACRKSKDFEELGVLAVNVFLGLFLYSSELQTDQTLTV